MRALTRYTHSVRSHVSYVSLVFFCHLPETASRPHILNMYVTSQTPPHTHTHFAFVFPARPPAVCQGEVQTATCCLRDVWRCHGRRLFSPVGVELSGRGPQLTSGSPQCHDNNSIALPAYHFMNVANKSSVLRNATDEQTCVSVAVGEFPCTTTSQLGWNPPPKHKSSAAIATLS